MPTICLSGGGGGQWETVRRIWLLVITVAGIPTVLECGWTLQLTSFFYHMSGVINRYQRKSIWSPLFQYVVKLDQFYGAEDNLNYLQEALKL